METELRHKTEISDIERKRYNVVDEWLIEPYLLQTFSLLYVILMFDRAEYGNY